ncbi:hypothetical protein ABW54_07500 [Burkholderia cenocepacia]|nr:hypothetical protein ABW54_07500 [Burkholderia cenocepacia]
MFCALAKDMTESLNPEKDDTILSFREVFKTGKPAELNKKRFSKTGVIRLLMPLRQYLEFSVSHM